MKKLKKEQTTAFTIRPPVSACRQLERIAKSYNTNRAALASEIIQAALRNWSEFEELAEKSE